MQKNAKYTITGNPMKNYKSYLSESERTYNFKVKFASDLDASAMKKIRDALEEFKVVKFSDPRRLPIQESPEFPAAGPVEIKIHDLVLQYPATPAQVFVAITNTGCCQAPLVKVISESNPYNAIMDGKEVSNVDGKPGEAVLLQPEMKTPKPDSDLVGMERIPNLIKELQAARNYEYPDAAGGKTPAAKFL
jgi:hypothetical protein